MARMNRTSEGANEGERKREKEWPWITLATKISFRLFTSTDRDKFVLIAYLNCSCMVIQICFTCNFSVSRPIPSSESTKQSRSLLINDPRLPSQLPTWFVRYRDSRRSNFLCKRCADTFQWDTESRACISPYQEQQRLSIPIVLDEIESVERWL